MLVYRWPQPARCRRPNAQTKPAGGLPHSCVNGGAIRARYARAVYVGWWSGILIYFMAWKRVASGGSAAPKLEMERWSVERARRTCTRTCLPIGRMLANGNNANLPKPVAAGMPDWRNSDQNPAKRNAAMR